MQYAVVPFCCFTSYRLSAPYFHNKSPYYSQRYRTPSSPSLLLHSRPQIACNLLLQKAHTSICRRWRAFLILLCVWNHWESDESGNWPGVNFVFDLNVRRSHMTICTLMHFDHPTNWPECPGKLRGLSPALLNPRTDQLEYHAASVGIVELEGNT